MSNDLIPQGNILLYSGEDGLGKSVVIRKFGISEFSNHSTTEYAMQTLQEQLKGQADAAGLKLENDVAEWITQSRREENAK